MKQYNLCFLTATGKCPSSASIKVKTAQTQNKRLESAAFLVCVFPFLLNMYCIVWALYLISFTAYVPFPFQARDIRLNACTLSIWHRLLRLRQKHQGSFQLFLASFLHNIQQCSAGMRITQKMRHACVHSWKK